MHPTSHLLAALACSAIATAATCHDYVLVSTRGSGEGQGPSIGFPGMINQTLSTLPNGVEYDVVYPATTNGTAHVGAEDLVRFITAGVSSCPNQNYAVLAYSLGSRAAALGLTNLTQPSAVYSRIRAVLVVGDEVRQAKRTANVDQNGGDSNRGHAGRDLGTNGTAPIPDAFYDDGRVLDICYSGDNVCDATANKSNVVPHISYTGDKNVQAMGARFLIAQLSGQNSSSSISGNATVPTNGTAVSTPQTTTTTTTTPSVSGSATPSPSSTAARTGAAPWNGPDTARAIAPTLLVAILVFYLL